MGSMKRKLERDKLKRKKKRLKQDVSEKMAMFGKLESACLVCEKPFDKNDKEQVQTWNVVVRKNDESVRLYCPDCWKSAIDIIEGFKEHLKEKNNAN